MPLNKKFLKDAKNTLLEDFKGPYHCSEAVLRTVLKFTGDIQSLNILTRAANPFGGGVGDVGDICGGVTGATMAIGVRLAPETPIRKQWPAGKAAKEFYEQFVNEIGTVNCKEIRRNLPWQEASQYCDAAVIAAMNIALEIIDRESSKKI